MLIQALVNNVKEVITLQQSERSLQFKDNYLNMREAGKTVAEIADYYHLSRSHAYRLIQELAQELGVPHETLLYQPHYTHVYLGSGKMMRPVKPIDFSAFQREFQGAIEQFDKTIDQMEQVLKTWPEMPAELMEDSVR